MIEGAYSKENFLPANWVLNIIYECLKSGFSALSL